MLLDKHLLENSTLMLLLYASCLLIFELITWISARPRAYTLHYFVKYSFRSTSSSHSLQVKFPPQQFTRIGYCYWDYLLQRPRNCMCEDWILTWHPFWFTSSLHSLQANLFSNWHGYFNYNHFLYYPHKSQQRPRN